MYPYIIILLYHLLMIHKVNLYITLLLSKIPFNNMGSVMLTRNGIPRLQSATKLLIIKYNSRKKIRIKNWKVKDFGLQCLSKQWYSSQEQCFSKKLNNYLRFMALHASWACWNNTGSKILLLSSTKFNKENHKLETKAQAFQTLTWSTREI